MAPDTWYRMINRRPVWSSSTAGSEASGFKVLWVEFGDGSGFSLSLDIKGGLDQIMKRRSLYDLYSLLQ